MHEIIDIAVLSSLLVLSACLLPVTNRTDRPTTLARLTLTALLEARPTDFGYEFFGSFKFGFKSYYQLIREYALLRFPPPFRKELEEELKTVLDLIPFGYELEMSAGRTVLKVEGGERRNFLCAESIPLTLPTNPPIPAELTLRLYT